MIKVQINLNDYMTVKLTEEGARVVNESTFPAGDLAGGDTYKNQIHALFDLFGGDCLIDSYIADMNVEVEASR